ncbi:MAG: type I methionyl aminopeptidase [Actinomycetota bacterium]|nr:type I methionyl aminopeptidase [Actinomycetota bacterium]
MFRKRRMIQVKTPEQVARMREAGLVVGRTLEVLRDAVAPGLRTRDLDAIAEESIRSLGAVPSFKGYHGFPATICASVNDEIVHGIPGDRKLVEGDIVSLDCGAIVDGWHGDAAITVPVGEVDPALVELMTACENAMWHGLAAARPGARLTDISHAVETAIRARGNYGIVEEYVGHGIGTELHQEPQVPNYGKPGRGPKMRPGIVLAIEPMVNAGRRHNRLLDDGWTVTTADGRPSAHFEHTVAVTAEGPWILTALDGGRAGLAGLGVSTRGTEGADVG